MESVRSFYVGASYRYAYEGSLQAGINLFPSFLCFILTIIFWWSVAW